MDFNSNVVKRSTTIISQKEYNDAMIEYGQTVKESVVPRGDDAILHEVWNVYTIHKFPDTK